jgi:hypothetical protein
MFKNFKYYAAALMASVFTVAVLAICAKMPAFRETGIGFLDAPVMLMFLFALIVALVPFGSQVSDKARVIVGLAIVASVLVFLFVQEFGMLALLALIGAFVLIAIALRDVRDLQLNSDQPSDVGDHIAKLAQGYRPGDNYDEKH